MEGIDSKIIFAIIISFLQIRDSTSPFCLPSESVSLKTKFKTVDDDHDSMHPQEHFLLHRERDARYAEAELTEAYEKQKKLTDTESKAVQNELIKSLKQKQLSATHDFHDVYKGYANPVPVSRYQPGSLTESVKEKFPKVKPQENYRRFQWTSSNVGEPSASPPETSSSNPFQHLELQSSIRGPDVKYMLGPRENYLKQEQNTAAKYVKYVNATDNARRYLPGGGNRPNEAASIFNDHYKMLLENQQAAERDYNDVRDFKQVPWLAGRYNPKKEHEQLKKKIKDARLKWKEYKKYLKLKN